MRRLLALMTAAVIVLLVAGCGNSAGTSDPYELLRRAGTATMDQVQVDIGANIKSSTQTLTFDPGAIRIVVDKTAGKGSFHLSLPTSALGIPAAQLAQLGVTGNSIDLDALWDGQALYAKSPVLGAVMPAFAAQMGITLPSGDLTGWLKLLSKTDLDTFGGGAITSPSAGPTMGDAATIKKSLEDAGVTLTLAGTESKNGVNANHIKGTVDSAKLLASPAMANVSASQRSQVEAALKDATVTFDIWTDASSNRFVEIDLHMVGKTSTSGSIDVTVGLSTPSSPNFDTPSGAVEIPTMQIVGKLIQMFGASLGG